MNTSDARRRQRTIKLPVSEAVALAEVLHDLDEFLRHSDHRDTVWPALRAWADRPARPDASYLVDQLSFASARMRERTANSSGGEAVTTGPTEEAMLERARSLANDAVWMVWLQRSRWQRDEPDDEEIGREWRRLLDVQFLIVALRRVRRSAEIATRVPTVQAQVREAISRFDDALPGLAMMRNVGEHIDDYAVDHPDRHHKRVRRQMLQNSSWDDTTFRWLGESLNVDDALDAAQQLYLAVRNAQQHHAGLAAREASGDEPDTGEPADAANVPSVMSPATARAIIAELAADPDAAAARIAASETLARALQGFGHTLWYCGWMIGPDRVTGASPFGFGSDGVVGLATVAQTGGELGAGAAMLLSAGNRYAAAALLRQIVEVEYLAWAFADDYQTAMQWLHADRNARRKFWSPAELRKRSDGHFLASDYWHHCDLGGHPTRDGLKLLPDHTGDIDPALLWAELARHLHHVWTGVVQAARHLVPGGVPDDWLSGDIDTVVETWTASDRLSSFASSLSAILRDRNGPPTT